MYIYRGKENGLYKVEDTDDGVVGSFTGDDLRKAMLTVGEIQGLHIDTWGNVVDDKGLLCWIAPMEFNRGGADKELIAC